MSLPARLAALLFFTAFAAQAGTFQMTVVDADGKPVPDVVVQVFASSHVAPKTLPAALVIEQKDLRFVPFLTVASLGSTVRFVNHDSYDHHVKSMPSGPLGAVAPAKTFELRLAAADAPGKPAKAGATSADVKLDAAGPIGLGCHLHSSMRGQLYVSDTPWFAKTDATGVATIADVPDGPAEAKLWHPDQLAAQTSHKLAVTSAPLAASATLNFTPRRRRG